MFNVQSLPWFYFMYKIVCLTCFIGSFCFQHSQTKGFIRGINLDNQSLQKFFTKAQILKQVKDQSKCGTQKE